MFRFFCTYTLKTLNKKCVEKVIDIKVDEFLHLYIRLELDTCEEAVQALRNLLLLVGSLTTCGYTEIKPSTASSGSIYQIPGFALPQPAGKGNFDVYYLLLRLII